MKWTPLQVAACAAAVCLSGISTVRACSDQSSKKTPSPSGSKSQDAKKQTSSTDSHKDDSVSLTVEESSDKKKEQDPTADRHLTRGDRLARSAMSYRGAPYRFGGQSFRTGFDCSGLVQAVCAKWGIYLPRAANAQFSMGKPVGRDDLQPGDLVFFANTYKAGISHVGIFIGDGEFIHACGGGKGVIVTKMEDDYHKKHYAGARRLDLSKLPSVAGEADMPKRIIIDDGHMSEKEEVGPPK